MKFRWLQFTDVYREWDDWAPKGEDPYSYTRYEREPILQFFYEKEEKWVDVPTIKEERKQWQNED